MFIEFLNTAAAISALLLAAFVLLRLKDRPGSQDLDVKLASLADAGIRIERALREESARSREEASTAGKSLREELANQIRGFQDSVLKTIAEMGKGGETRQTELHRLMDNKLGGLQKDTAESDRALRIEVQGTLQTLGESITTALAERLELLTKEIGGLTSRQQQDQLELRKAVDTQLNDIRTGTAKSATELRQEVSTTLKQLSDTLTNSITAISRSQTERLQVVANELAALTKKQEAAQENLRLSVEKRLDTLRGENSEKLERIRQTVDEQLQGTLEKRLGESFKLVSERLDQVHKGLGEMQSLASGVGDLKRVLTNVKTRGTWGEVQLGNLLEQMLTPEQYLKNTPTKSGSQERVEFAVRLPGREDGEQEVLLPIDAKFPHEDYDRLVQASERGDSEGVESASKQLELRIRNSAKGIHEKYHNPPHTTDFAIMYMPTEGLYAEVLRRPGLAEQIQHKYRVTLAGPTTLAAMLNALQMGFQTLAIQKRSSEVWRVLGAVKTQFNKYGEFLGQVQKKLQEASNTIDKVAQRHRAVDRTLRTVDSISEDKADAVLGLTSMTLEDLREDETREEEAA